MRKCAPRRPKESAISACDCFGKGGTLSAMRTWLRLADEWPRARRACVTFGRKLARLYLRFAPAVRKVVAALDSLQVKPMQDEHSCPAGATFSASKWCAHREHFKQGGVKQRVRLILCMQPVCDMGGDSAQALLACVRVFRHARRCSLAQFFQSFFSSFFFFWGVGWQMRQIRMPRPFTFWNVAFVAWPCRRSAAPAGAKLCPLVFHLLAQSRVDVGNLKEFRRQAYLRNWGACESLCAFPTSQRTSYKGVHFQKV